MLLLQACLRPPSRRSPDEAVGECGRLDLWWEGQRPAAEHQQPGDPDEEALVVVAASPQA
jgi:hypothetical protein